MSPSGGTSAASPVWGGIMGLLNDARFRANLPAIGFLNPWIYRFGKDFLVDITQGRARGCDGINHQSGKSVAGSAKIPGAYWNATVGWDPATGQGIPDFQKMLKFFVTDWPPNDGFQWGRNLDNDEEEED
jgi:tripeptidyl-peptidase-1